MNKDEYFSIGQNKTLPLRCPILNYCTRRAYTIYYYSDYNQYDKHLGAIDALQKDGTLPIDFKDKQISLQGESPIWIRGNSHFYFSNTCPEINLFDGSNSLFKDVACTEGSYDKEYKTNKHHIIKCQHYSECPEFNHYLFEQKKRSNSKAKKRPSIPYKTKTLLQKEINSICPICSNEDVDHFQIHHIDENPENNDFKNLLMLCPTCHSKITKNDITHKSVIDIKGRLSKI